MNQWIDESIPLRDGVTGNTSGFELEDEGSTPSPAANLFQTQQGTSIHLHQKQSIWRLENEASRSTNSTRCLSVFRLLDYRGLRHGRLHSPRAERIAEKSPSTPIASSVQTKKKCPLELAILLVTPTPRPVMWT